LPSAPNHHSTGTGLQTAAQSTKYRSSSEVRNIISEYKLPDDAAYSLHNDIDTLGYLDTLTAKLEWHVLKTARGHDNYSLAILRSMKGLGKMLSLTVLDDESIYIACS
jgi:hypothetical protein